ASSANLCPTTPAFCRVFFIVLPVLVMNRKVAYRSHRCSTPNIIGPSLRFLWRPERQEAGVLPTLVGWFADHPDPKHTIRRGVYRIRSSILPLFDAFRR